MCGITGFLDARGGAQDAMVSQVRAMERRLVHRGPDDGGTWVDAEAGLAFAQRRLAVVDLSEAGHQPMVSSCGRFVINYNGEVYNADELRPELVAAGRTFRGHSDTEVIVEGCAVWGLAATLKRLIGMFAIAVWDRQERTLSLARDRMGIKPLYYGTFGPLFLFGSELWALRAHTGWTAEIDRNAVASYLRHNYIPAPLSIYQGVNKLLPGTLLSVQAGHAPVIEPFWSLDAVVANGQANPFVGSDAEAIDALDSLLSDAVRRRMVADVPVGAFLSGGIDSSTVVALMQKAADRPVRTFSIGFHEAGYNEAEHAKDVARHLGTDHTELYVTSDQALAVIPKLPAMFDEPFADSSQIPTYLVSALTRQHVTVSLSGDGGDELFAGYNRYFQAGRIGKAAGAFPLGMRRGAAKAVQMIPPAVWDTAFSMVPPSRRPVQPGDKMHKLARILAENEDGYYLRLISLWDEPDRMVHGGRERKGILWDPSVKALVPDYIQRMRYLDMQTYLPDDILTKVDRASMAVALEARVPILDHRVVAFSWSLSNRHMIRDGQGKWILRQVLDRYVPRHLVERPKMGFGVPIDGWLRGPLKEWAADLLSRESLRRHDLIDPEPVARHWVEHLEGSRNWQYMLWDILMLQAWMDGEGGRSAIEPQRKAS